MGTALILLVICFAASTVGAVVGAGGGVIIKPLLDFSGLMPAATASFCSGCTVLAMSTCSLITNRGNGVKLHTRTSTPLAIGAALGGLLGKWLFELLRSHAPENTLAAVQAGCLAAVTLLVLLYVRNKHRLPAKHVKNLVACLLIGCMLGTISAFLGIGGGPNNLAVLFFFFSMDAKEAAKNSLYIILFSQAASLLAALASGTVPPFSPPSLVFMMLGGVGGALAGRALSKRLQNSGVERLLHYMMLFIIAISLYNMYKYTGGMA